MRKSFTHVELKTLIMKAVNEGLNTSDEITRALRGQGIRFNNKNFSAAYRELSAERKRYDFEIIEQNLKLATGHQKQLDLNRIKNKSFREFARLTNALEEQGNRIVEILDKYDFSNVTIQHETATEDAMGVVQLADLHLNELVNTQMNVFDFNVAAKRMKKYAIKARAILKANNIKSVLVASTGDLLNSDRRLDEFMSMSTNRTSAMMLGVHLIEQFLLDLAQDFNITFIQISGNESRLKEEYGFGDITLSDNYDVAIYNILKKTLRTAKGITFSDGDLAERVFDIMGQNVLFLHGQEISSNTAIKDVQAIKGKYAQYGVPVSFVIFGHVHTALVHDHFARSASLVGANAYTDRGLQLTTRASQNIHVFFRDGSHDTHVIDLQTTGSIEGYSVIEELAYYNAKSESKLHTQTTIHQIVV
jgi:predicted phosphodiesterase